ncbi:DUF58 domain-containing protein [Colwelliaceae bacterium BS250]
MSTNSALDPDIYTSVDALTRLKFKANGFTYNRNQPINSILAGKNNSKLRGRGLNFEEMRQYQIGDDIRTMDWKVTNRTGKPHVKVYTEERERNIILLVDQRQSMFFGSTNKMKSVIAAEIAALSAWQVIASTDRIGAVVFNDERSVTLQPKRSSQQAIKVFAEITKQNHQLESGITSIDSQLSLENMFQQTLRVVGHDALVILISDGYGWNDKCTEYTKRISQHNDIVFCHVTDPLEHKLAKMSQMVISDGNMQVEVSAQEKSIQESFESDVNQAIEAFVKIANKHRIPLLPFNTIEESDKQLRRALGVLT